MRIACILFFAMFSLINGESYDKNYLFRRLELDIISSCTEDSSTRVQSEACIRGFNSRGVHFDVYSDSMEQLKSVFTGVDWKRAFNEKLRPEKWVEDTSTSILFIPPTVVVYASIPKYISQNTRIYLKKSDTVHAINCANIYSIFPISKKITGWKKILLDKFLLKFHVIVDKDEVEEIVKRKKTRFSSFPSRFTKAHIKKVDSVDSLLYFEQQITENYLKFSAEYTEPSLWGYHADLVYVYDGNLLEAVPAGDEKDSFVRYLWLGGVYESIAVVRYHISDEGEIQITDNKIISYSTNSDGRLMMWRTGLEMGLSTTK